MKKTRFFISLMWCCCSFWLHIAFWFPSTHSKPIRSTNTRTVHTVFANVPALQGFKSTLYLEKKEFKIYKISCSKFVSLNNRSKVHPISLRTFDWCFKFWDFSKKKKQNKTKISKKTWTEIPKHKNTLFFSVLYLWYVFIAIHRMETMRIRAPNRRKASNDWCSIDWQSDLGVSSRVWMIWEFRRSPDSFNSNYYGWIPKIWWPIIKFKWR